MSLFGRPILFSCAAIGALVGSIPPALAGELVRVELVDGRTVTGTLDAHTDAQRLWLRRDQTAIDLASGFAWQNVRQVSVGGQNRDLNEFQQSLGILATPGRQFADLPPSPPRTPSDSPAAPPSGKATSLVIEAYLAQLDDDAMWDGLRIFVFPLNAAGQIIPLNGQIDFTLVAEIERLNGGQSGPIPPQFREIERATYLVKREHFARGPAIYELVFSKQHPDFDPNLATQAMVHARLGIPGQGVLEASTANVMLRECSRFRDQLQYYTPARYLPLESGGRSR